MPADLATMAQQFHGSPALNALGVSGLVELMETEFSGERAVSYARIVRDAAQRRRLIDLAARMAHAARQGGLPLGDAVAQAQAIGLEVINDQSAHRSCLATEIAREVLADFDDVRSADSSSTALQTGFVDLDAKLGGLQPGSLYVIAGRPSMGKSSLVASIVQNLVLGPGRPVLIFSLEVPRKQIVANMACALARLPNDSVRSGILTDQDATCWRDALARVGESPLYVDDQPDLSIDRIRVRARIALGRWGVGLIVVDYLQLIRAERRLSNREREVAEISATLKVIARECGIPVIAVAQLNRGVETRKDKRPKLADLRESGAIEQDADAVMLLYREGYYDSDTSLTVRAGNRGRAHPRQDASLAPAGSLAGRPAGAGLRRGGEEARRRRGRSGAGA